MTNIKAGELRHRMIIEQRDPELGDRGEYIGEWCEQGRLWAKITPLWGRELEVARRRQENISMRVITRNRRALGFDTSYRLTWRGAIYNVGWVQRGNDDEHEDWHIMCSSDGE